MKNELLKYIMIDLVAMRAFNVTLSEYAILQMVYKLSGNPKSKCPGWCYASKETLAANIGLTARAIFKMISRLEELGLIERSSAGMIRVTSKWYDAVEADAMNSVHSEQAPTSELSSCQTMNSVHASSELSSYDNSMINNNDNLNSCASPEAPTEGELFVTQTGELGKAPSPTNKKAQAETTEAETVNVETLPAAPKENYIGELCDIYAEIHMRFKGIKYIPRGKDRKAMGQILSYYKRVEKDGIKVNAGKDKEQTKLDMRAFFEACHRIQDPWLSQNMELPLINSQFYKILGILKNGANKQVFGYNKRAEQQTAKEFQDLYGDHWQEEMSNVASRGFRIHL